MPQIARVPLTIVQGASANFVFRWATGRRMYADISAVPDLAPLTIAAVAHGIVADAWPVLLTDMGGINELNSNCEFRRAVIVDVDTLRFDDINAKFAGAYTSGGTVTYFQPVDLTGYTARMQIRPTQPSETVLEEITTSDARLPAMGIVLTNATKRIDLLFEAAVTELYTWVSGVYMLELVAAGGEVYTIAQGPVRVVPEVTRP
jgi:hypothetical protein